MKSTRLHLLVLGDNIRKTRQRRKLTQQKLSDKSGLHRTYICDLERGARNPTVGCLLKVARAAQTTAAKLLTNV